MVDADSPKKVRGMPAEDLARMEREMETLERDYKMFEERYGENALHLNAAQRYVRRLMDNAKVKRKTRAKLGEVTNYNLGAMLAPLSALLTISGYAELYSGFSKKNFSTKSREIWDAYFANLMENDEARKFLIRKLSLTKEPRMHMSMHETFQFEWKRATRVYMSNQGIRFDSYTFGSRGGDRVDHPNPIVRIYASRGDFLNDADDIFFAAYLFRRPEATGVEVPHSVESFQRALTREESREGDSDV